MLNFGQVTGNLVRFTVCPSKDAEHDDPFEV